MKYCNRFFAVAEEADAHRARWAREVLSRGVDPATIPYPLDFTPEMQRVARSVSGSHSPYSQYSQRDPTGDQYGGYGDGGRQQGCRKWDHSG